MLLSLSNKPRDYAWGSTTLLAEFEGREPSGSPEAEVWFGDHPSDPADVAGGTTLDAVTGGSLPYLLKFLAAAAPLSIQAHPTKAQAQEGWAREAGLALDDPERNYRDDNHKPELLVALSDRFEALSGVRPLAETERMLAAFSATDGVRALRERLAEGESSVRSAIAWALTDATPAQIDDICAAVSEAAAEPGPFAETLRAVARIAERNPGDAGVVVALLMNYVVLRRGEGVFVGAGFLHAYLSGLAVEIMAASDNVLRGGLTPKRIDVPELLRVIDPTPAEVRILAPQPGESRTSYPSSVPDFALSRITLTGEPVTIELGGPTMVLATAGEIAVAGADGACIRPPVGGAVFATEDERSLVLSGTGEVFLGQPGA